MAYGTVANTVIDTTFAPDVAIGYIDRRMKTLMGSLNASAEAHKDGDLGVIEEWLDYCDGMGPRVQSTLDALENVGRF